MDHITKEIHKIVFTALMIVGYDTCRVSPCNDSSKVDELQEEVLTVSQARCLEIGRLTKETLNGNH